MSQQINLLLPGLRPRFDWLALPVVAGVSLAGLLLLCAWAVISLMQVDSVRGREAAIKGQLAALQQQVQSLGQSLGARRADDTLSRQIDAARLAISQRQEVLNIVAQGDIAGGNAYSGLLQGFSRQILEGVWLVGFGFADKDIEIRGRLVDPALLPAYISKLNAEPVFSGRHFAALDMLGVDPAEAAAHVPATPVAPAVRPAPRYTSFALRSVQEKAK